MCNCRYQELKTLQLLQNLFDHEAEKAKGIARDDATIADFFNGEATAWINASAYIQGAINSVEQHMKEGAA